MKRILFITAVLILPILSHGQEPRWLLGKEGKYRYETNIPEKTYNLRNATLSSAGNIAFKKNVADVAEWFHQNHPMILNPTGYDMRALSHWSWGDFSTITEGEYGIPATLDFLFEIFDSKGGKWSIEPPQSGIMINNIAGGHDGWYFTPESIVEDGSRYDLSQADKVNKALQQLRSYFPVFPLKGQLSPGVNEYESYPGGRTTIVVFNPEKPPFWIPVTVKEMADAHLAYYSLFQKVEIDRMVLDELKKEIAELSPAELAAPAYAGHDSHFVLKVNGRGQGLQIMRFNPAYWDKSVPQSAIQFMTFWNANLSEEQQAEDLKRRGYPEYPQLFINQINWSGVAGLIEKGK